MDPNVKILIKDLKNKSPQIRQNAVKELGKLQVEDAIDPLIKMANAGFRKFLTRYDFNDQLAAIDALAETGNTKALNFIEIINKCEDCEVKVYGFTEEDHTKVTHKYFPYVRGDLGNALDPQMLSAPGFTEDEEEARFRDYNAVLQIIQNALKKINETVDDKNKIEEKIKTLMGNLKSEDGEVRRSAATELGKMQVKEAIVPLIEMANGETQPWERPKYTLEDQVVAIKALAETGSIFALEYLKQINTIDEDTCEDYNDDSLNPKFWTTFTRTIDSGYIYVTGPLRDKLHVTSDLKPDRDNEYVKIIEDALKRINETVNRKFTDKLIEREENKF